MRATQANASSGASFPAFKALFEKEAKEGVGFQPFIAEAFDSAFIAFFAALEAKSSDPTEIAKHVVSVTNDPGTKYNFEQIDDAIKAVLAGEKIHFVGATGDLNFSDNGRVNSLAYDIWEHQQDGSAKRHRDHRLQAGIDLAILGPHGGPGRHSRPENAAGIVLQQLAQLTVNGLITGTILALTGVGATLVFGIQRIANFAHGEYLTFAAYVGSPAEHGLRAESGRRHARRDGGDGAAGGRRFISRC